MKRSGRQDAISTYAGKHWTHLEGSDEARGVAARLFADSTGEHVVHSGAPCSPRSRGSTACTQVQTSCNCGARHCAGQRSKASSAAQATGEHRHAGCSTSCDKPLAQLTGAAQARRKAATAFGEGVSWRVWCTARLVRGTQLRANNARAALHAVRRANAIAARRSVRRSITPQQCAVQGSGQRDEAES